MERRQKVPGFHAGFVFLGAASFMVAAFGVAGWVASDESLWLRVLLGIFTGLAAGVIPFTIVALGRSWHSAPLVVTFTVFAAICAYSFHHAVDVLIETPRLEAATSEADKTLAKAEVRVDTAQAALDNFPALVIPADMGPRNTRARTEAWQAQRAPLEAALVTAKTERNAAKAARDTARDEHQPLAPQWVIWLVAALVDLGIACGIYGLEATRETLRRRILAEEKAAASETAEAAHVVEVANVMADTVERMTAEILDFTRAA